MPRLLRFRALAGLLLILLAAQSLGAAAYAGPPAQPGGPRKLLIDASDTAAIRAAAQAGGTLLADYGSFALWSVTPAVVRSFGARPTVAAPDDFDTIFLRSGALDTRTTSSLPVPNDLRQARAAGAQLWMVQFLGPIQDGWLDQVRATGARLVSYIPNNAYVIWADAGALEQVERLTVAGKGVQWAGPYHPAYRLAPSLLAHARQSKGEDLVDVTVQLYTTDAVDRSLAALRALGGQVYKQPARVLDLTDITLQVPAGALIGLAGWADVFNIEPWSAPRKLDEMQGQIIAGNVANSAGKIVPTGPGYLAWLASAGLPTDPAQYPIVDVVDDGVDNGTTTPLHPDYYQLGVRPGASRIAYIGNCTNDALGDGGAGHGNLNAGIVGGYNNQPNGAAYTDAAGFHYGLGIAPYTRLAGTKIFKNSGAYNISNCGNTDQGVVAASYNAGAALTSNSWGDSSAAGAYDASAQAYDALTRDASASTAGNQQMAHIFAAGNDGPSAGTLGSPGTAKNVITVGATENVRENGVTDGCGESSNDNADDIVGFSSRGPADDGRTKPDIMAPGSHIQGPASQAAGYDGTGVCDKYHPGGQTLYTWSSGTSHSTPAVAGAAALLYTNYRLNIGAGSPPSPAMLKAYMLNSTRYLTGASANDTLPSNTQGYGDVYLKSAFDNALKLFYDQQHTFGASGEQDITIGQVVDTAKPFVVTLAWTDAPGATTGNAYVNNLDLEVTVGGQVYKGNHFGAGGVSTAGGAADTRNNVEKVMIPAGVGGNFSVKVVATNIAGDGVPGNADATDQDFALAIYNGSLGPVGTLRGAVKHAGGTPIPGALVATDKGFSALTDASGNYSMRLPVDTYTVTASISGYSSQTVNNIAITANVTTTQDFVLAGGAIQGQVFDQFTPSRPIAGATVTAGAYSAVTDAGGSFFMPRVPVGSYTLTATRQGYAPASATVSVADDAVTTQNLSLPGGAIQGQVTDAASGQPIAGATLDISGNPSVNADSAGRYAVRLAPGAYTLTFRKIGYVQSTFNGVSITSGITTTNNVQLTPILSASPASLTKTLAFGQVVTDTPGLTLTNNSTSPMTATILELGGRFTPLAATAVKDVLLVNRSALSANTAASAALTSLGYTFDAVSNTTFEGYSVATLQGYRAVVYLGNTGTSATNASNTKLIAYLDAGGRLLIADNDLGYFNHGSQFYDTYLDATYGGDEPDPVGNNASLIGEDIMAGVNPASVDPYPDYFTPKSNSTRIFRYAFNGSGAGSRISRASYRAVYLASDLDLLGTSATGEAIEATVMQRSLGWLLGGGLPDNIAWLREAPDTVAIAPGATAPIAIGWYANQVAQPGTYTATLQLQNTQVPTQTANVPVTLVVNPTGAQGKLTGTISTTGVCDTAPAPVAGARVNIQGTGGFSVTLTTDAGGQYSYWLDAGSYTVSASAASQSSSTAAATVNAGATTTRDFVLRLQAACIRSAPPSLSATLQLGAQITKTLTITSAGALPLNYSFVERSGAASSPDASGYLWVQRPAEWIDASGGTANNPLDDGEFNITLPFAFPFYDITTNQLRVGNNGAALVNATAGEVEFSNGPMGAGATPNYFLAPFWDDFSSQTGAIYVQAIGSAPDRKVVVEWRDRPHYNGVGAATFEMVLYEGGSILYQYQDVDFGNGSFDRGASATIGIRGPNAASSSQFSLNAASVSNNGAVCFVRPGAPSCSDVPWVAETPATGTGLVGTPPSAQSVAVTFDASAVELPGVYTATLAVAHNAPQPALAIPLTMTVALPAGWGSLSGRVTGLGPCDAPGSPLAGVPVSISATPAITLTTDAAGSFGRALPAGTYTLEASAAGYLTRTLTVSVTAQAATTADLNLRRLAPCASVDPGTISSRQATNQVVTRTLTLSNTGAANLAWAIEERAPARPASRTSAAGSARRPAAAAPQAARSAVQPLANVVLDGGFEASNPTTAANPYWSQGSTNYGTVLCTEALCGNASGTVAPRTGSWMIWFGGISAASPTEIGSITQDVVIDQGTASLSFWLKIARSSGRAGDYVRALIDGTEVFSATSQAAGYTGYQQVTVPVTAFADGGTHTLRLESQVLTGDNSNFLIDDVALDTAPAACAADALPWLAASPASGATAADSGSAISVAFNSAGLATGVYTGTLCLNSNDVRQPSMSIPVTLTVDVAGFTISPASPPSTTEAGGTATFSVQLNVPPSAPVTIGLSSSKPAEGSVAPASLLFTQANWETPQIVTVTGVDDSVVDGNIGYTIVTAPATSADPHYNGLNPPDVNLTNVDDDTFGVTIGQSGGGTAVAEGGATDSYTLVLNSQPAANVTISFNTGAQIQPIAALTFTPANWNVPQTAVVRAVDDSLVEGPHSATIAHSAASADPHYNGAALTIASVTVAIADNDAGARKLYLPIAIR